MLRIRNNASPPPPHLFLEKAYAEVFNEDLTDSPGYGVSLIVGGGHASFYRKLKLTYLMLM
jgi:hypothetical protein